MAQVLVTNDNQFEQPGVAGRQTAKASHNASRTPAPAGPALAGEGLELLRSSHC